MTILTQEDGYRIQEQNYKLKSEIESLTNVLRLCHKAFDDYFTMSVDVHAARNQFQKCNEAIVALMRPY